MLALTGFSPVGKTVHNPPPSGCLQSQPACPAARDANVACDGGQHAACAHHLLAIGAALHAIALVENSRLDGGIFPGNARDRFCRDRRYGLRPVRSFGNTIPRTKDIIGIAFRTFDRHLAGIEADAVCADKFGII